VKRFVKTLLIRAATVNQLLRQRWNTLEFAVSDFAPLTQNRRLPGAIARPSNAEIEHMRPNVNLENITIDKGLYDFVNAAGILARICPPGGGNGTAQCGPAASSR
jgi:hypothetical protein